MNFETLLKDNGDGTASLRILTVGSVIPTTRETPTGTINSSNVTFTLAHTPQLGSEMVFLDGLLCTATTDYTISGLTITFVVAPATSSILRVTYYIAQ
jgi:hypothetical protein